MRIPLLLTLALGAVAAGVYFLSAGPSVTVSGDLRVGGLLEEFSVPELQGSGRLTYASLRDKPVVLNFFASWCPFCIAEMPAFERVHGKLSTQVNFIGIAQSDSQAASQQLVRQTGITYLTGADPQGKLFRAFGGVGMPTTVFIRPGGEIAEIHVGPLSARGLSSLIAQDFGSQYAT